MIKVMFVCHGNICRSPMAELILKDMIKKRGCDNDFIIASSATSTEEIWNGIGNPIYPPAAAELAKHGLRDDSKRATLLLKEDYDKYDYFLCMDERNMRNIFRIFPSDPEGKVKKLMSYEGSGRDVADPWYCGNFDVTYRDIYEGCKAFLEAII